MPEVIAELETALESLECDRTPPPPDGICIRLPFGIKICSGKTSMFKYEGPDEILLNLLKHLEGIMAPLMAVLIIASIIKAIVDCIKAIPESIGSLSPGPIISCLQKLAKVLPQLFEYIPPFSYIPLIVDLVRAIIYFVDTLIAVIEQLFISVNNALQFKLRIEVLPGLGKYEGCVDDDIAALYKQIAEALNASGPLFKVLATMLGLIDIPPLRPFIKPLIEFAEAMDAITGDGAESAINEEFLEDLADIRKVLQEIDTALQPFHIGTGPPTTHEIDLS